MFLNVHGEEVIAIVNRIEQERYKNFIDSLLSLAVITRQDIRLSTSVWCAFVESSVTLRRTTTKGSSLYLAGTKALTLKLSLSQSRHYTVYADLS